MQRSGSDYRGIRFGFELLFLGAEMVKKVWRCTVCGHLHEGETPPELCPVCHADASKFELVSEEVEQEALAEPKTGLLREMLDVFVPHAVFAHFPNALIPTTALFWLLFLLFGSESFETSAFYLLVVTTLAVPPTFATGLYDWKKLFAAEPAPIFIRKIILAAGLLTLGITAALWRWLDPRVMVDGGWPAGLFLLLLAAMFGCVIMLGHYGGILVFARNGQLTARK